MAGDEVIDQSPSGATGLLMAYAQSFLRGELGKMYRGELVLRGIPEIEPLDGRSWIHRQA